MHPDPAPEAAFSPDLAMLCAGFAKRLRTRGIRVSTDQAGKLAAAISGVQPHTTEQLYWCAKTTLISHPEDFPAFDRLFSEIFGNVGERLASQLARSPHAVPVPKPATGQSAKLNSPGGSGGVASPLGTGPAHHQRETQMPQNDIASPQEVLGAKELSALAGAELQAVEQAALAMLDNWPTRSSRRRRPARRGSSIALRRSLAGARKTAGEPIELWRTTRVAEPLRLVILVDVSGSMAPYAPAYLHFSHVPARAARTEVFTFGTRLHRLTPGFSVPECSQAVAAACEAAIDRNGGTRISESLETFLRRFGRRGMARGAIVVIFSDGWEQGDPAGLGNQMAALRRLARKIIWVNPRKAAAGFQPLTGGMAAALSHCDAFLAGNSISALGELAKAITEAAEHRSAARTHQVNHAAS